MRRPILSGYLRLARAVSRQHLPSWAVALVGLVGLGGLMEFGGPWACAAAHEAELCPRFRIRGEIRPALSATEKRLVCGDPKSPDWRVIPRWQAEYNLKNFLEDRGLFSPRFAEQGGVVTVDVGPLTRVSRVGTRGAPNTLNLHKKRFLTGEVITPAFLNQLEGWVAAQLKAQGYPCPVVRSYADPRTGEIRLDVVPGPIQDVASVTEDNVPGLDPGVFRRFDAFGFGERFDDDLLTLTSLRITRQGLFDSAYFLPSCGPSGAVLRQQVVVGPPRLISFQAGFDTEGYLIGGASWSSTRLGRNGSNVTASVLASTKQQNLYGEFDWYVFGPRVRRALRPVMELMHDNERFYEYTQARIQAGFMEFWDWAQASGRLIAGPQIYQIHTFRGTGPASPRFLAMSGQFQLMTHDYELYLNQPRSGTLLTLNGDFTTRELLSTTTAQRLGARVESLWNLGDLDPPLLVVGLRGSLQTTLAPGQSQAAGDTGLPPNFTYFLGGSQDLRGFALLSLPGSGIGALTVAFGSLESRFVQVLPFDVQPFAFIDAGAFGPLPATLREPIYYSPGIGLRWAPAFGSFRGTVARGFPLNSPGGWNLYFSFGQEF